MGEFECNWRERSPYLGGTGLLIGGAVPGSSGVISATVVESDILGDFSHILGEIVGLRMVEIVGDPGMGAKLAKLPAKLGIAPELC